MQLGKLVRDNLFDFIYLWLILDENIKTAKSNNNPDVSEKFWTELKKNYFNLVLFYKRRAMYYSKKA